MTNPFEELLNEIKEVKAVVTNLHQQPQKPAPEIIGAEEICKRLNISAPTLIKWRKKKKIPSLKIGNCVRYNWPNVVESLESAALKKGGSK